MALVEVAHDPFASETKGTLVPVTHDPFAKQTQKFTGPDEDTSYSPEGIPLVTPSTQGEPTGAAGSAARIMTDVSSAPIRASLALAKPFANVASWAGINAPKEAIKQMDVGIKEQGPEFMGLKSPVSSTASLGADLWGGTKALQGLGALSAPIATAFPFLKPVMQGIGNSRLAQSTLGGATLGAVGADTDSSAGVAKEAGIGALLGGATHGVLSGAGKMLDPLQERIKQLRSMGLSKDQIMEDTTIGQLLGGFAQKAENFISALPFGGAATKIEAGKESLKNSADIIAKNLTKEAADAAKMADLNKTSVITGLDKTQKSVIDANKQALDTKHSIWDQRLNDYVTKTENNLNTKHGEYSAVPINRVLAHLGEELPKGQKLTTQEQIAHTIGRVSDKYEKGLAEVGDININYKVKEKFDDLLKQKRGNLGGEDSTNYKNFKNDIDELFTPPNEAPILSAQQWHTRFKDLSAKANEYQNSALASERNYGKALKELKNDWMNLIEESSGSEKIKAANAAHSALQPIEKAASYIKSATEGGNFDPKQLLQAIGSESSTRRFAAGEANMQKDAAEAYTKMMAERQKLKAHHEDVKSQLDARKEADKLAQKQKHSVQADNLANQRAYVKASADAEKDAIKSAAQLKKEELQKGIADATKSDANKYAEHRLLYGATGLGGLGAAGHYLNIPIEAQAGLAGGLLGGSNILYSKPVQEMFKKAAMAERPQGVRDIGKGLKEMAPVGALTAVNNWQNYRQKPGVQVLDPETGLPIPAPLQVPK